MPTSNLLAIEASLATARKELAQRVEVLRAARQAVRDAQEASTLARRAVRRFAKRKSRLLSGKN